MGPDAELEGRNAIQDVFAFAEQRGWKAKIPGMEGRGAEAGIKSATIEISGEYAYGYLLLEECRCFIAWCACPFNAESFAPDLFRFGRSMPVIEDDVTLAIRTEDLRIDTYRSSGAGGQNVNKTESAVRIAGIAERVGGRTDDARATREPWKGHENAARQIGPTAS